MSDNGSEHDWVTRLADDVVAQAQERSPGETIVCASGISPSGPIHLGNFRELITPHLVADEIQRRGVACEHILSWDDYDRFRRVPKGIAGVDDSWEQYIGMPLSSVPPPAGSPHASWADHFKAPLLEAMAATGIEVRQISQTERYRAGAYREQVLLAMRERATIDKVLDQYRTLEAVADALAQDDLKPGNRDVHDDGQRREDENGNPDQRDVVGLACVEDGAPQSVLGGDEFADNGAGQRESDVHAQHRDNPRQAERHHQLAEHLQARGAQRIEQLLAVAIECFHAGVGRQRRNHEGKRGGDGDLGGQPKSEN